MSMYYLIVNEEKDSGCQVAKGIQAYMQEAGHRVLVQSHDAIDIQEKADMAIVLGGNPNPGSEPWYTGIFDGNRKTEDLSGTGRCHVGKIYD